MHLLEEIKELDRTSRWNPTFQILHLHTRKLVEDLTQTAAKLPHNRVLNRYRDVLPYDTTRVQLKTGKNDYINASFVEVLKVKRKYILAQGPLPSTIEDFWRMIWENGSKGIIMLNKIIEKNMMKCHPYWPMGEEEELELGEFVISNYSCDLKSSYIVRELLISNSLTGERRLVKQFHYVTWPDFGVPNDPSSFLEFLAEIKSTNILNTADTPSVVHCSAGIGRSGTFCLIDASLEMALHNNNVADLDPHSLLLSMRTYRCGLVQTAEQLRFAHIAIVYGLYTLFPGLSDLCIKETDDLNIHNNIEPPPLPPRKTKESVPQETPLCLAGVEEEQRYQERAYRQFNQLELSTEGSSDEEILDLSNEDEDSENPAEICETDGETIPLFECLEKGSEKKHPEFELNKEMKLNHRQGNTRQRYISSSKPQASATDDVTLIDPLKVEKKVEGCKKKKLMKHIWMYT